MILKGSVYARESELLPQKRTHFRHEQRNAMKAADLLKKLMSLLYPDSCIFCGEALGADRLFCDACRREFLLERDIPCPRCGRKAPLCTCPTTYLKGEVFPGIPAAVCRFYNTDHTSAAAGMTRTLILRCKTDNREGYAEILASDLAIRAAGLLYRYGEDSAAWSVTYIPRNPENLLKYGFDHGEAIAREVARKMGCSFVPTLFRYSGKVQKGLTSEERQSNAEEGLAARKNAVVSGGKYILVDDVLTTGATMAAASKLLYECGAAKVLPAAVAKSMRFG